MMEQSDVQKLRDAKEQVARAKAELVSAVNNLASVIKDVAPANVKIRVPELSEIHTHWIPSADTSTASSVGTCGLHNHTPEEYGREHDDTTGLPTDRHR